MSRTAPKHVVEELQRYDPEIDVYWMQVRSRFGVMDGRWVVVRKGRDGTLHRVMTVQEDDGSYRDCDNRILQHLHRTDTRRFLDPAGRLLTKEYMNSLGMKASESDEFVTEMEKLREQRYAEDVGELAEQMKWLIDQANLAPAGISSREIRDDEERRELKEIADDAMERGVGKLVLDERLGCARRVE